MELLDKGGTMKNTSKTILLSSTLVFFLASQLWVPRPVERNEHAPEESIDLMVAARGLLIEEDIDDGADIAGGGQVFSIRRDVPPDSPAEQILVRLINATKKQLGDYEQVCNEMRGSLSKPNLDCEDKLTKAFCDENIAKLRARLSFLRKVRGDRRKGFTKAWHSIKRAGARIWRNIGPIGRRILRNLGDEAFTIVKSGGSLHGGVLRKLVIKHAKTVIRREKRKLLKRTFQRVVVGRRQTAIAEEICKEEQVAAQTGNDQTTTCPNEDWFEAEWMVIEEILKLEGKYCQKTAVKELRTCLWDKAVRGVCKDEAFSSCDSLFDAIPANDTGGSVALSGQTYFGDADPNVVQLTYPSAGGNVQGTVNFQRHDDVFGCTYTLTAMLDGSYDPSTCAMNGTASIKAEYAGDVCVSVCGSAPSSPTSCPVEFDLSCSWEATLEDGKIRGAMVDENCDRGYFQFRVPFQ